MKTKIKIIGIILLVLIISSKNYSQILPPRTGQSIPDLKIPNQIMPTPQAYALSTQGATYYNESSGNGRVTVPLYNYSAGKLNVPITLTHYGGGVKVDEIGTNTGIRWLLNAGGLITRTVNDLPDELYTRKLFSNDEFANLSNSEWKVLNNSDIDSEVDEFQFNFNGYSGHFILDKNLNPTILGKEQEIKIEMESSQENNLKYIEFIITTPNGIKYYFGSKKASEFTRMAYERDGVYDYTVKAQTAFYLHKIESFTGDIINLEYDLNLTNNYSVFVGINETKWTMSSNDCKSTSNSGNRIKRYFLEGNKLDLVKISSNRNSHGVLFNFDKSGNSSMTKEILIGKFSNSTIEQSSLSKKIKLDYLSTNNRFFLQTITVSGNTDNGKKLITKLEYDNPTLLPVRFSFSQDYEGYFNGKANSNAIPATTKYPINANRSVDPIKSKYGTLTKIIYPTNGYTEFEYECIPISKSDITNNTYRSSPVLKKVKKQESDSANPLITSFIYTSSNMIEPKFYDETVGLQNCLVLSYCNPELFSFTNTFYDSLENTYFKQDPNTFFDTVKISYGGENYERGGKMLKFANGYFDGDLGHVKGSKYINYIPKSKRYIDFSNNGKLISETIVDNTVAFNGNTITKGILEETFYEYSIFSKSYDVSNWFVAPSREKNCEEVKVTDDNYIADLCFINYMISPVRSYLTGITLKKHYNGTVMETKTNFKYDQAYYGLPSNVSTNTGTDIYETKYKYAFDSDITFPDKQELVAAHRIATPLNIQEYKNGKLLSTQKTIYEKVTINASNTSNTSNSILMPKEIRGYKGEDSSLEESFLKYSKFDDMGNLLEFICCDEKPNSLIRGYNNSRILAKVIGAKYDEISSKIAELQGLSNSGNETQLNAALDSFRSSNPNYKITTYTHDPLIGLSTKTDIRGIRIDYDYDELGNIVTIKDETYGNILSSFDYNIKN